jgi:hypothetical protein
MMSTASATSITIAKSDLDRFIGTYDAETGTFVDFVIAEWDTAETMSYFNAINEFPNETGVYFGPAPWYTNLAQTVLPYPELGIVLTSFVDVKLSYSAKAIVVKWHEIGDSLEFACVMSDFPNLGGAPNLDACFLFPDGSYLLVARSAGGDMESIWHRYTFLTETPSCTWAELQQVESIHSMFETDYIERRPKLIDTAAPVYYLQVINIHHTATGDKKPDGSFIHEVSSVDTTVTNLWEKAQEAMEK